MVEKLDTGRLNELAEFFVLDYLKKQGVAPDSVVCIDIDGLTTDYFGYRVVYENIAEDDLSKTAFAPNGVKPLKVKRNGTVVSIVFPADWLVLDRYYQRAENSTARRFTVGHELAHKILAKVAPEHNRGSYQMIFDKERIYTIDELREMMSMSESQANQMSAALQLPIFLLKNTLKRVVPLFFILIINHDAVDFPRNRRAGIYGNNALGTVGRKVRIVVKFAALSLVFRMTEGAVLMSADYGFPGFCDANVGGCHKPVAKATQNN